MNKSIIITLSLLLLFTTCKKDIVKKNSPRSVFEVFWHTMDERYVFFEEKNLNWDSIYNTYYPKINDNTTDEQLKTYFQEIINYIKDGHVSITMDKGKYIKYKYDYYSDDYPYYNKRRSKYYKDGTYIGSSNAIMAQSYYNILYIKINSFRAEPHLEDLYAHINQFSYTGGIIVDISENGGGSNIYLREWASLFFEGTKTFFYEKNKTGKAHSDFSEYIPIDYVGQGYFSDSTPIVLITSNYTYSAGSFFTALMKELPNCRVFGEPTGGGGGGVTSIMLPNNWFFRFTVEKVYDISKYSLEEGVQPDTLVLTKKDSVWDNGITEHKAMVIRACIDYLKTKDKNTN